MFSIKEIKYQNLIDSVQLSNNFVDLVVAREFGPRIIHFGLRGQPNMFNLNQAQMETFRSSDQYHIIGGHRLWTAPEDFKSTYISDNHPVEITNLENGVRVYQPASEKNPIAKTMEITLNSAKPTVHVNHIIQNDGIWAINMAPWALSVMAPGGTGIMPLPMRGPHGENLLPNGGLVFWAYTNFADQRWRWGFENICVQQDPTVETPLKFGAAFDPGWIGYLNHSALFVKSAPYFENKTYPDRGTPYQIFLNNRILECETLGPIDVVEPGQSVVHEETWALLENVEMTVNDESINQELKPRITQLLKI